MKKTLSLLILGLVAFGAMAWWLSRPGPDDRDLTPDADREPEIVGRAAEPAVAPPMVEARRTEVPVPSRTEPLVADEGAAEVAATGAIRIEPRLDDALPSEVVVDVEPAGGIAVRDGGALELRDLEPGSYRLTLHGAGLVPRVLAAVSVEAGTRRVLSLDLERGVRVAGEVRLARWERPVANPVIALGDGSIRTRGDAEGRFVFPGIVPRNALRVISIRAEGYDEEVHHDLAYVDPAQLVLYVGGGEVTIEGRLVNGSDDPLPERFVARLLIGPERTERRRIEVEGETGFRFENVYGDAEYRLEVSFPDGAFPRVHREVRTPTGPEIVSVPILLQEGADFEGVGFGPDALKHGLTVELRDARNRTVASAALDPQTGAFSLRNVEAGRYEAVLTSAHDGQVTPLGPVEVGGADTRLARIDLLRRRLALD